MRAIVFDIDNTLTPPRRAVEPEMAAALRALSVPFHLAAGSDMPLVEEQLIAPLHQLNFRGQFDAFACNGAHRYRCELGDTWTVRSVTAFNLREHLGASGFDVLLDTLRRLLQAPEFALDDPAVAVVGERIIDRGAMLNLAPIGRPDVMTPAAYANRDAFVRFDERTRYRRRMLARLNDELAALRSAKGLRISLGGQTSFDIVIEGYDKRYPLRVLLDEGYRELIYIGDALYEGGNDAAVLDFIARWPGPGPCPARALQVNDWHETLAHLRALGVLPAA